MGGKTAFKVFTIGWRHKCASGVVVVGWWWRCVCHLRNGGGPLGWRTFRLGSCCDNSHAFPQMPLLLSPSRVQIRISPTGTRSIQHTDLICSTMLAGILGRSPVPVPTPQAPSSVSLQCNTHCKHLNSPPPIPAHTPSLGPGSSENTECFLLCYLLHCTL